MHLGDYIYETDRDRVRKHEPPVELRSLAEYRARYASYRSDPNLAAVHRRHPMIWVWDDHETVDGTWMHGADPSNHDPAEDGDFATRKLVARQAALEWLPIRSPDPGNLERIYRRFAFGGRVAIGTQADPTPTGRFYVNSRIVPVEDGTARPDGFYGVFAFGTSAHAPNLSDWPGGGIVAVHGTNRPDLIPGRVSKGCVRVSNERISRLRALMPLGTPIEIVG